MYKEWELERLQTTNGEEILQWCLDSHQASLLTIEYGHLVELDSKHHLYVWALIDLFFFFLFSKSSSYALDSFIRVQAWFTRPKKCLGIFKPKFFLVKHLKIIEKCRSNWLFFHDDLKCIIPRCDLQHLSLKVMLKRKWLDLNLDINFMILTIWNFMFYIFRIFIKFIIHLRSSLKVFVESY